MTPPKKHNNKKNGMITDVNCECNYTHKFPNFSENCYVSLLNIHENSDTKYKWRGSLNKAQMDSYYTCTIVEVRLFVSVL